MSGPASNSSDRGIAKFRAFALHAIVVRLSPAPGTALSSDSDKATNPLAE